MSAQFPTQNSAQDLLEILLKNSKLLSSLSEEPRYKKALAEELEVSTKTVYRRAKQLKQYDVISRSQSGYQLTEKGNLLTDLLFRFQSDINSISEILNSNPESSVNKFPPSRVLSSASLAIGHEETPCQSFDSLLQSSKKVQGILPPFATKTIHTLSELVERRNVRIDLILNSQSEISLRAPSLASLRADQNVTIDRTNDTISYGIFILDGSAKRVIIILYNNDNVMRRILKAEDRGVIEWAENRYEAST